MITPRKEKTFKGTYKEKYMERVVLKRVGITLSIEQLVIICNLIEENKLVGAVRELKSMAGTSLPASKGCVDQFRDYIATKMKLKELEEMNND